MSLTSAVPQRLQRTGPQRKFAEFLLVKHDELFGGNQMGRLDTPGLEQAALLYLEYQVGGKSGSSRQRKGQR